MDCKYFNGCSAPLCPLDEGRGVWFPGEKVCKREDTPAWVKKQVEVSKIADPDFYFTKEMLGVDFKVTHGLDPDRTDKERESDERSWIDRNQVSTKRKIGSDRDPVPSLRGSKREGQSV